MGHARSNTAGGEVEQGRGGRRLKELRILRFSQISRVALRPTLQQRRSFFCRIAAFPAMASADRPAGQRC